MIDTCICQICHSNCLTIRKLGYHIKSQHNITPEEYYRKFYLVKNEDLCENCGKPLKFGKLTKPFAKTCSRNCVGKNNLTKERRNKTNLEKFGATNPFAAKQIKQQIKDTLIEKYGGYGLNSNIIKSKAISTNIKKYGVDNPWKAKAIIDEMKTNMKSKISQFELDNDCTERQTLIYQYGQSWLSIEQDLDCIWLDNNHKFIKNYELDKIKALGPKFCRHALNDLEVEIFNYVKSIYSGEIRQNDRRILGGKELDIYIPNLKLGIEIDGDYWHSDLYKDNDFHYNKSNMCLSLGIRLIHIQEYFWKNNPNKYKQYLKNLISNRNYFEIESKFDDCICLDYNLGLPEFIDNYIIDKFSGPIKFNIDNFNVYGSGNVIYRRKEFEHE